MCNKFFKFSKKTQFFYTIFNNIEAVDPILWDKLKGSASIYLSYDYLQSFERGMKDRMGFRYLIFYNQQKIPVAISTFQIVSFKIEELLQDRIPYFISDKIGFFFENKELKLLICGNLFACGENGFANSALVSKSRTLEIISDTISELYTIEKGDNKISFALFKEFWPKSFAMSEQLKDKHFNEFTIDENMVLRIDAKWDNFNTYLSFMNTKYRTRTKNVLKKSKLISKREFSASDIEKYLADIKNLYVEVLARVDYNLGVFNEITFVYLKEKLKNNFVFTGYFLEDIFIGFSTAFIFNRVVDANFIGVNYEFNNGYKLYQRILYDYVNLAIQNKSSELRLGRTAEIIKSGIGAKPVSMKLYTKHRNCIPTKLMRPILTSIKQKTYELRNPFKN